MDDLLPEYERELAILRESLDEFAQRYPKVAARLAISGGQSDDPHVERLIQSAAILNARTTARIEDDFPEFTKSLLEIQYPEFLRPFPSCAVAQLSGSSAVASLTAPVVIERGTELKTRLKNYRFRTAYDVTLAPLKVEHARYALAVEAPSTIALPEDTTGLMSITFASMAPGATLGRATPETVRLFVDGERTLVASVLDTLLLRTVKAFAESDKPGIWKPLECVPVSRVGFEQDEALIELNGRLPSQYRLLSEYFAFPRKFDFVDIDLRALLRAAGHGHRVTLHLPVSDLHRDSTRACTLQHLSASNLKPFCTPIINLFAQAAEPIAPRKLSFAVYPVVPNALNAPDATVYSVDSVRLTEGPDASPKVTPIMPYHSLLHYRSTQRSPIYWVASRDARLAEFLPGHDMLLSLVDETGKPIESQYQQVDAKLLCTNGNLPASLRIGACEGDLEIQHNTLTGTIMLLHRPTESVPAPIDRWKSWDLISMLASGPITLDQAGLPALKASLAQHIRPHAADGLRHIDGLVGLRREKALEWVVMEPQPMFVRGLRVQLTVDEDALGDCSLSVLAGILEGVFARHTPTTSFVQLMLVSAKNGAEVVRGRSVPGTSPVI